MILKFAKKNCLYIIYDSITNSVFQSQVFAPTLKELQSDETLHVTILSFERNTLPSSIANHYNNHKRLSLHIQQRMPYLGTWSLYSLIRFTKNYIKTQAITHLKARGPFAGFIAQKASTTLPLCIQARGLVAEEWRFTRNDQSSLATNIMNQYRYWLFTNLERSVYSSKRKNAYFEVVSPALQSYLIEKYNAQKKLFTAAAHDAPAVITSLEKKALRKKIRTQLHIDETTFVYCYSGSAHPWQCIDEAIDYFQEHKSKHMSALLLMLTCDATKIKAILEKKKVDRSLYRVINVNPDELYEYLAAADVGFLFRKKDIINWVARPTKMLEYKAARLPIIHNNTIELLAHKLDQKRTTCFSLISIPDNKRID